MLIRYRIRTCKKSYFAHLIYLILLSCIFTGQALAECECVGNGTCYDVTDNTSFDAVPWATLESGDTVRIHYRAEPYRRIVGLRSVGTSEQPIKVCGVKGSNEELPVISAEDATPIDGYLYDWGDGPEENIGDFGTILIGRSGSQPKMTPCRQTRVPSA
jgi:hypothetical protein